MDRRRSILVLSLFLSAACGTGGAERDPNQALPPNILVVTVDTLRRDHLGCYGYFRDTSPNIDALAAESLLFEECFTPVGQTLPAHTSLFTGLLPREHGVLGNRQDKSVFLPADGVTTLAESLGEAGYHTAGFVAAEPVKRASGIARGFDTWWEPARGSVAAVEVIDEALAWLGDAPAEPWFAWVHVFDPHRPYRPAEPYASMFVADEQLLDLLGERSVNLSATEDVPGAIGRYDGEIRSADAELGRLFEALRSTPAWERTATLLTADHGECLWQNGSISHGVIWLACLKIPLLIRVPGVSPRRVSTPIQIQDAVPTLMGLVDDLPLDDWRGQASGRDVLQADVASEPLFFQNPANHRKWTHSVVDEGWRLIIRETGQRYLFDLNTDPHETMNVYEDHPERVEELQALLTAVLAEQKVQRARFGASHVMRGSNARLRALEELGYAGDEDEDDEGD